MPFKYHPPTRTFCAICEKLSHEKVTPIIDTHSGKASSANNYRFHNWYNFVLGYSPQFPEFILNREKNTEQLLVVDPFMGTGTTNVYCKTSGISSIGIEANDYFIDVAKAKLEWDINIDELKELKQELLKNIEEKIETIDFESSEYESTQQLSFFDSVAVIDKISYREIANKRPPELLEKYICDRPYVKLQIISDIIDKLIENKESKIYNLFKLALSSIIVPSSNISYGPGFGVRKPKVDVNVIGLFSKKINRMIDDLESIKDSPSKFTKHSIIHGDSRQLSNYLEENSVDLMITSPPYPGDHEYTKHTRLELIFEDHARTIKEFRVIKKRMLTGSTTNIYKEDNDRLFVKGNETIQKITDLIQQRLDEDNATSGFEKLYTRLVWEYFGGMARMFKEALKVLKDNGKFSLLVSDSHAFKMVHIRTADILKEIALEQGYREGIIELWQNKKSTSHNYNLREEILTIIK